MRQAPFNKTTGTIFSIIAILHLLRVIYSWPAQIGTFIVPLWLSWAALIVSGFLAYSAFNLKAR